MMGLKLNHVSKRGPWWQASILMNADEFLQRHMALQDNSLLLVGIIQFYANKTQRNILPKASRFKM